MFFVLFLANSALASVPADKLASSAEFVDSQPAVIGAASAVCHGGCIFQGIDLFNREHSSFFAFFVTLPGDQSRAERSHDPCNIRTDCMAVGDFFKASENCVIIKGSALYHNVLSELRGVGNLDYFVKRIFDNGIGKSGRNIRNLCSFFLSLFHLGVHKYRTSCSEINGMFCIKSRFCKILHTVVQRLCKGFNKGTAPGGAGFVKLHTVHGLIFDLNAFHILTADIKDTVYLRIKKCSSIIMGNGFYLSLVKKKRSLDQSFSVSCGTGIGNVSVLWQTGVNLLNRADGRIQRTSVVAAVKGIKKASVFAYKGSFRGGASCINAEITVSAVGGKLAGGNLVRTLAFCKFSVILL